MVHRESLGYDRRWLQIDLVRHSRMTYWCPEREFEVIATLPCLVLLVRGRLCISHLRRHKNLIEHVAR